MVGTSAARVSATGSVVVVSLTVGAGSFGHGVASLLEKREKRDGCFDRTILWGNGRGRTCNVELLKDRDAAYGRNQYWSYEKIFSLFRWNTNNDGFAPFLNAFAFIGSCQAPPRLFWQWVHCIALYWVYLFILFTYGKAGSIFIIFKYLNHPYHIVLRLPALLVVNTGPFSVVFVALPKYLSQGAVFVGLSSWKTYEAIFACCSHADGQWDELAVGMTGTVFLLLPH